MELENLIICIIVKIILIVILLYCFLKLFEIKSDILECIFVLMSIK